MPSRKKHKPPTKRLPAPEGRSMEELEMSPTKQATPKYNARAAVGRRANTLRLVLRKLCGDIKEEDQRPNQSDQEQAQQSTAAVAGPENVAPQPEDRENLLIQEMSESLDRHKMSTGGGLKNTCPGRPQVCALSRRQKPLNPFEDSSLNASPNDTPHGAPDQPNEHNSFAYNLGGVPSQTHAQHPQAAYKPPVPSTPSGFEETHTISAGATDLSPYISSDLIATPTTCPTTALPTQSQEASYQAHPPPTATTITAATPSTPSPPYITAPTTHNANHHHDANNDNNRNHNPPNPNPNPAPHRPPRTNLQYTSMRLAVITDTVQLTPNRTGVRVTNRREALQQTPEALVPI